MTQIPNWFLGRNTSAVTFAPCALASDGTLTAGTTINALAYFTSIKMTMKNTVEEISGTAVRAENDVIVSSRTDFEIVGLIMNYDPTSAGDANSIATLATGYDYVKFTLSRAGKVFTFYGVIHDYEENIAGKGKVNFTFNIGSVGVVGGNPTYA